MLSRCQLASNLSKSASRYNSSVTRTSSSKVVSRVHADPIRSFIARGFRTDAHGSNSGPSSGGSIFSTEDTWDEIFQSKEKSPIIPQHASRAPRQPFLAPKAPRRQAMTERETKVLTGMLDMIFEGQPPAEDAADSKKQLGVGGGHLDDLFGRLRRHSRLLRWAKDPSSHLLDEKKEQMTYCTTDQELLEWASREVFDESKRYEDAAKRAIAEASESGGTAVLPMLQSPIYPQMIAHLMRTFREQYKDPNLALYIFSHAQKLSIISYVFGCSTEAYNELIETRWSCFRDLQGVHNAIEEMVVNAVLFDSRTRKFVEAMRRDIGNVELHSDASEEGQQEILKMLSKIERSIASTGEDGPKKSQAWDQWKKEVINEDSDDNWSFGNWDLDAFKEDSAPRGHSQGGSRRHRY